MKYIQLNHTDLEISRLALGCMRIANKSPKDVEHLVQYALDAGINFFDHADIYGGGRSEELFGQTLKANPSLRDKMYIQTKCGIIPGKRYDFSYDHIVNSLDQSLARLQTDHVDFFLLHRPDALADPSEVAKALNHLYAQGKFKYFGVSNHTAGQIALLNKYLDQPIMINQLQFSIIHSVMIDAGMNMNMVEPYSIDHDGGILDYCRLNDILIQPWSPFQASWADGTFIDHPKYEKLNAVLESLAQKYQTTKSGIALAWILRHPACMQPILGTTS
ncbi:MAG: aldo/keto reductase, partial [bacterium]